MTNASERVPSRFGIGLEQRVRERYVEPRRVSTIELGAGSSMRRNMFRANIAAHGDLR